MKVFAAGCDRTYPADSCSKTNVALRGVEQLCCFFVVVVVLGVVLLLLLLFLVLFSSIPSAHAHVLTRDPLPVFQTTC